MIVKNGRAIAVASAVTLALSAPAWADLCQGLVQDRAAHPMTALAKPAVGQSVVDPQFGTRIRRLTAVTPGSGDAALVPMYSTTSAWNADESKLILYHVGRGHELYDGRTYAFIRSLPIAPTDLEQVYWHTSDPDVFFFPSGNRLVRYHVSTGVQDTVHTFTSCQSALTAGDDPLFMSWDSSTIGLKCDGQAYLYRITTNTVLATASVADGDPPQSTPSATLAFAGGTVYDTSLRVVRHLDLANPFDHGALGRTAAGHDTWNSVAFDPGPAGSGVGSLVSFDLTNGQSRVVVGPATGFPYPPSGTHVSTLAYRQPGWTYLSIVGDPSGQGVLSNEIVLADVNSGTVCRVAHHRSFGDNNSRLGDNYWAEPHVTASPSGTRAIFASDWGNGATVDTYVVELPSYQPLQMTVTTDRASYISGQTMSVSLRLTNAGWSESADLFLLEVMPDGNHVLDFTPSGTAPGTLAAPAALVPLARGVDLHAPFNVNAPAYYRHAWNGNDTPGTYTFAIFAVRAGALSDNRFDPGDIMTAGAVRFTFTR